MLDWDVPHQWMAATQLCALWVVELALFALLPLLEEWQKAAQEAGQQTAGAQEAELLLKDRRVMLELTIFRELQVAGWQVMAPQVGRCWAVWVELVGRQDHCRRTQSQNDLTWPTEARLLLPEDCLEGFESALRSEVWEAATLDVMARRLVWVLRVKRCQLLPCLSVEQWTQRLGVAHWHEAAEPQLERQDQRVVGQVDVQQTQN